MEHRIVLAPGNVFSVSQSAAPFLRFNVAQMSDPRIFSCLRQVMREQGSARPPSLSSIS
jgi:DNA-binding transcriptional MocR family regulator